MIFNIISGILIFVVLLFFVALKLKDNSIVDIGWGIGFIIISIISLISGGKFLPAGLLVSTLVTIWGLRLALHIFIRGRGKGEDFRYKKWREEWGKTLVIRSFFQIFILQGFFMLVIGIPIIVTNSSTREGLNIIDFIGAIIWIIGFIFQAVSDFQLLKFKKNPASKGKIMKDGLWKYSRHPNYFGESVMWWGIFIISISSGNYFFSVISPLTITFLLLKVSGVPMLEEKYRDNDEYQDYIRKTSAFFPRKPLNIN